MSGPKVIDLLDAIWYRHADHQITTAEAVAQVLAVVDLTPYRARLLLTSEVRPSLQYGTVEPAAGVTVEVDESEGWGGLLRLALAAGITLLVILGFLWAVSR